MRFGKYVAMQLHYALSSSLALGLLVGLLVLVTGGAEGSITLDINLSNADSIWFLLGIPAVVTLLFCVCSPLSFFIYRGISLALSRRVE